MHWIWIVLVALCAAFVLLFLLAARNRLSVRFTVRDKSVHAAFRLSLLAGAINIRVHYCIDWSTGELMLRYKYPFRSAEKLLKDYIAEQRNKKKKKKGRSKVHKAVRTALLGVVVRELSFETELGVEDAAKCALLCGSVSAACNGLFSQLRYADGVWPRVCVKPVFNNSHFSLDLTCIATFSIVQIITEKRRSAREALSG